jgi:release factor glutamine methyltransferase
LASDEGPDVRTLLSRAKDRLKRAGIPDYTISAEIILRDLLDSSRSELILNSAVKIDSDTAGKYEELIEKRADRYPLQYLTGSVEFCNVKLRCDARALIPRPETEILVETVIGKLKGKGRPSILDIGTGSGNIAIALARNLPGTRIIGVDISQEALDLAADNIKLNNVQDRIELLAGDINDDTFVAALGSFDCVVSNPPYVSEEEAADLQPEVIEFEPHIALFCPGEPLAFFKAILKSLSIVLKPGGLLALEMPMGRSKEITKIFSAGFTGIEIFRDLAGIQRVLTAVYSATK